MLYKLCGWAGHMSHMTERAVVPPGDVSQVVVILWLWPTQPMAVAHVIGRAAMCVFGRDGCED